MYRLAGECYGIMKDCLAKNGIEGSFQREIIGTLSAGRMNMRNLCILGLRNIAKSFLLKPLCIIFRTYVRPDGGLYQLESLQGKELMFLNDFEYDESARS